MDGDEDEDGGNLRGVGGYRYMCCGKIQGVGNVVGVIGNCEK